MVTIGKSFVSMQFNLTFSMIHIKKLIRKKSFIIGAIIIVLAAGYWLTTRNAARGETRYVTAPAERGILMTTVSGTGQVLASTQLELKPKAGGEVVYVAVQEGQTVRAGALLVQLDAREANKAVRDAQVNLEAARLSLEKLKQPAEALTVLQAEHALLAARETKQKAEDDLTKSYDDGFNNVANAFLDLPTVITGLHDVLYQKTISDNQQNFDYYADAVKNYDVKVLQYHDDADAAYQAARRAYDNNFADYKSASRFSSRATIEALINETYATTKTLAEAVKSTNNLIQFYKDKMTERGLKPVAVADTHLTELAGYTNKTNTHLLSLLAIQNSVKNNTTTITTAERTIAEKTAALADLRAGADLLDIKTQEITIRQRENALADAREKLADYYVRAPFAGRVANVAIKKGDTASASTVVATLITNQSLAELSLNEIDVTNVKVGQKATLTFDAVSDLSISGTVAEVDTIGTETQGVVNYAVKISFDTQDERIRPGMSVNAVIITAAKPDVLLVPNSAVKAQGGRSYVEIIDQANAVPRRQMVVVGLTNDTVTEILSGLEPGQMVVTRTITSASANTPAPTAPSLFGAPSGGNRGGGGIQFRR